MAKGSLPGSADLRLILDEPGEVVGYAWQNVVVFVWRGDATAGLMRKLGPLLESLTGEVGRLSIVSIVPAVAQLPDEGKRQAYKEFIDDYGSLLANVALVIERKGFLGSAVRGLLTGLLLMTRHEYTTHVMSTIAEVAAWLPSKHAATTGVRVDPVELTRVLERAVASS